MTWTPAVKTRSLLGSAVLIDVTGMSAVNAHPILTCKVLPSTHNSVLLGPSPTAAANGRYHRSKRNSVATDVTLRRSGRPGEGVGLVMSGESVMPVRPGPGRIVQALGR